METLVLPAQDQFVHVQNHRLLGPECYSQNKYENHWETPAVKSSLQQVRNAKDNGSERCSLNSGVSHQLEKCSLSSPVVLTEKPILPKYTSSVIIQEGSVGSPGRRWRSMPCKLSFESNDSSIQPTEQGCAFPRHSWPSKFENGRTSRSDLKNRTLYHPAMNKKRTGCDWKPVETGPQNCRAVPIPKQRNSERKSPNSNHEIKMSNDGSSISPPPSPTENWAGPAYSNSPPPSSLPFPKFSMRQMRSASLELPSTSSELSDALRSEGLCTSSRSVPTSPSREVTPVVVQGFAADVASATKNLKRILHLDLGD